MPPTESAPATPADATTPQRRPSLLSRVIIGLGNLHRRMLSVYFGVAGPRVAYAVMGALARQLYRRLPPVRLRSEAQCRAALGRRVSDEQARRIAEQSFVHRVWNLADLMLADRFLHANTYQRYGGAVDPVYLDRLLDAQRRRQPAMFVTAYYGPFDLLPLLLGFNGLRVTAVYRPHKNAAFDEYRRRIRARSGCELVPIDRALGPLERRLEAGGIVAILADHHVERQGVPVKFLGLPTQAPRAIALLACRHNADIIVAGIRRKPQPFHADTLVTDIIEHHQWQHLPDPVPWITQRYLRGLEELILGDPSQYLWAYPRWGNAFAQQVMARQQ